MRVRLGLLVVGLLAALTGPVQAAHLPGHPNADQGLTDAGEEQAFARARELLLSEAQAPNVDTIFTVREQAAPRGGCPLVGRVYWGYARRGTICFSREPAGEGWDFEVHVVEGENPIAGQSRTLLHTLEQERAAGSATEGSGGDFRALVGDATISYPFAYERVVAELDSPRAGDFIVMPHHLADKGSQKGAHGHLGQVQSRSTLLLSGRGARTAPTSPTDELALGTQHVDIAPTVAEALGVDSYFDDTGEMARTLNGGPSATALLERQDGEVLDELLEPVFNTIVVVVDGLHPDQFGNDTLMPNLNALIDEPCSDPGCTHATVYEQARGVMTSETAPNHASMMTGGYVEQHGLPGDDLFNRSTGELETSEGRAELMTAETLFDQIESEAPWLETAAVVGKTTLRGMFDCTRDAAGDCGTSTANPEGVPVTHVAPDILAGAAEPQDVDPEGRDCPAEPVSGTGYAEDVCIMDQTLDVLSTDDPDFTLVNLGLTDGLQHLHGRGSPDHLAAVADADEQIGRLVEYLQESGKWQHASVIVTADHNFASMTAGLLTNRIFLDQVFGSVSDPEPFEVVTTGGYASVYLTEADPNELTADEQQTLADLRAAALATTGITEALYRLPNTADGDAMHTLGTVHPNWSASSPRIGELVLTADEDHNMVASPQDEQNALLGEHGRPTDRHVPFVVLSGGTYVRDGSVAPSGAVHEPDDTGALPEQAEAVDIAPTISWLLGVDPPAQSQGRVLNGPSDAFAKHPAEAQEDGDITEPIANRAAIFIYDQNNSLMVNCLVHEDTCDEAGSLPVDPNDPALVPNLEALAGDGTLTRYGSMASFPSVTFPNHNVVGSGAHPGHHDIVNNRFYLRETQTVEQPIDPQTLEHPLYHFTVGLMSQEVETLHEAVHRSYGDWEPADGPTSANAYTASVNEPSSRGADYSTLEPTDTEDGTGSDGDSNPSFPPPETFASTVNPLDLAQDTSQSCFQQYPEGWGLESNLDNLGQTQARRLYDSAASNGHPLPKYLINNFTLTDGAGHHFGPHTECTFAAYRDADRRLGRILGAMEQAGVLGETLIVVTGDHGGENVQEGRHGLPGELSAVLNGAQPPVEHVMTDWHVYLRTLDVETSQTSFTPGQPATVTFTVTDDDRNADDSTRPIEGATVTVEGVTPGTSREGGTVSGTTDANGEVTLSFAPSNDTIFVTTKATGFNERLARFGPPQALCVGLEDVVGEHLIGTSGGETLRGTSTHDVICGNGGDDRIFGFDGNDFLAGGDGRDTILPGLGADDAFGRNGIDRVSYADVRVPTTVDLSLGTATGAGGDTVVGFEDATGGRKRDSITGSEERNRLRGGKGKDRIRGLAGADRLGGGKGRDRLSGGPGKDRLSGGTGKDRCAGGPGKDVATRSCE
jgi:predicted AlkP superfamily pyrophosphatase or phosphodiesterase